MKTAAVRIGAKYTAKVSGAVVPVVVLRESRHGGWEARNEKTGRTIRIRSARRLREELAPAPKAEGDPGRATAAEVNTLRALRHHLAAQVESGVDTAQATLDAARTALAKVEGRLADAEDSARAMPECAYLFGHKSRTGRTHVLPLPSQSYSNPSPKEGDMARKSKQAHLEETLLALRRAEKLAGSTKWALEGAGAAKNPPSKERAAHLRAKLEKEQALVAELRSKRDELKA